LNRPRRKETESQDGLTGADLEEDDQIEAAKEVERVTVTVDEELRTDLKALSHLLKRADRITVDSKAQKVRRYIQSLWEEEPNEKGLLFTEYRDPLDDFLDLVRGRAMV
jgi:ribonuclease HI